MGNLSMPLASLIDWGWLRIGPYIHINIDPAILRIGSLKMTWYGLMYVVAIVMALWGIGRYTARQGITRDQVYRVLWWCIVAGLIGGRLYFVVQQPDLVTGYLEQPWRILATWEGGMAFFGAIFLVVPVLFWRSLRERVNPFVMLDAGALFAAIGQPFGRIGNLINGDIIGYPSTLPWATVYDNPNSWACLNPSTCHVPVQPSAGYELLLNLALIALLLFLARRYRRPGALMATYLFSYCITQFLVFFVRANVVVPLGPLDWGLKQAQWTALIVFILLIPITVVAMRSRFARPVPPGQLPAIYGIPQKTTPLEEEEAPLPPEQASNTEETPPASEPAAQPANVGADKAVDEQEAAEETEG
jgi:phosphatidylglycerol:prolipoprotein diacylglycerol transferase